jgi:hypothetical protein
LDDLGLRGGLRSVDGSGGERAGEHASLHHDHVQRDLLPGGVGAGHARRLHWQQLHLSLRQRLRLVRRYLYSGGGLLLWDGLLE